MEKTEIEEIRTAFQALYEAGATERDFMDYSAVTEAGQALDELEGTPDQESAREQFNLACEFLDDASRGPSTPLEVAAYLTAAAYVHAVRSELIRRGVEDLPPVPGGPSLRGMLDAIVVREPE